MIVFKTFDDLRADSADLSSADAIKAFVEAKSLPWVVELNQDPKNRPHLKRLFEKPSSKVLGFFEGKADEAPMREALTAAAKDEAFAAKLKFVIVEGGQNEQALKYFGLEAADMPALVIHDAENDKKYVKEKAAVPADLEPLIKGFLVRGNAPGSPNFRTGPSPPVCATHLRTLSPRREGRLLHRRACAPVPGGGLT